jgi:glycosyltransferase involved in cell wall biosynthesis
MSLNVAIIGDRGIPARYGGFSTLVEEVATRLVRDHDMSVTVYCRRQYYETHPPQYAGVNLVHLPAPGGKYFESLVHTGLSAVHSLTRRFDAVLVVDPGNAPLLPIIGARAPVALHTDGLGWKRRKWGPAASRYYKWTEGVCARVAARLVTDAVAMRDYYETEYGAPSTFIPYGSHVGAAATHQALERHGLAPGGYYLVVTRIEPDNNTDLLIREYRASHVRRPLVIVGGAAYPSDFSRQILAQRDERVRIVGPEYDSGALNGLYANSYAYLHGHEVGGTNPSLLRAMDGGRPCLCLDVVYHREAMGTAGVFFDREAGTLAATLTALDADPARADALGAEARHRARTRYRWDAVAAAYAELFKDLRAVRTGAQRTYRADVYQPERLVTPAHSVHHSGPTADAGAGTSPTAASVS